METTQQNFPQMDSFEQVLAIQKELTKQSIMESERQEKAWEKREKEWEQQRKAWEKREKDWEQQKEAREKRDKEWEQQRKETDKRIGDMCNRFGEMSEHHVAPGIAEKFNKLGYHFDGIASRGYFVNEEGGKVLAEIDILLENSESMIAVEVKAKPKMNDIEHHIKRLEILREFRSKKNDYRKIFGGIAGAIFGTAEKKAAIEAGFYVLEQSGDTIKIDIPQGFVPKEW